MKKHIVGLVAIAACALSSSVAAQTYASVAAGRGQLPLDCTGASACDKKGDAYRYLAGRRFPGGVSAELGLTDFGDASGTDASGTGRFSVTAITAGAAFDIPLGSWVGLSTRVGIAMLRTEFHFTSNNFLSNFSSTDKNVAPYVGFGFYVTPWQNIRLEFSADQSQAESRGRKGNVRAVMLGVRGLF